MGRSFAAYLTFLKEKKKERGDPYPPILVVMMVDREKTNEMFTKKKTAP